jgi:hypothetical protein
MQSIAKNVSKPVIKVFTLGSTVMPPAMDLLVLFSFMNVGGGSLAFIPAKYPAE